MSDTEPTSQPVSGTPAESSVHVAEPTSEVTSSTGLTSGSAATSGPGEKASSGDRQRVDPGPIEDLLAGVDSALARLDLGKYGTCEVCGTALEDAVLEADPLARHCQGHLPGTI